ncbi:fimbrial protein [Chromobacterium paludis]|uniref:Fimbrial protein n=1 Tax=Chromobacterium paludis TaxID=2605945 RepID=A0A5C1DCL5_9NEIS|nr:fimbrial protein [Chromobacterium paludis]QEL54421.1 fimbrial protein [Chromobacterium paludis]
MHARVKNWRRCCLGLLLALAMLPAWAGWNCQLINGRYPMTPTIALSGSYAVPRDMAVGSIIATFEWNPSSNSVLNCGYNSAPVSWTFSPAPLAPVGNGIYQTGVPGIGVRILHLDSDVLPYNGYLNGRTTYYLGSPQLTYQLIVTGPVSSGYVSASNLPGVRMVADTDLNVYNALPTGGVTITTQACSTPNVSVNLGQRTLQDFIGINQPMKPAAVGFNIAVNNCPSGMNAIQYQVDATTQVLNYSAGVVALDASSSAGGVAIQLKDGNGYPLQLGTPYSLNSYQPWRGGSYTIPLQATYYQTGSKVTGGKANTSVTFTMVYQ